MKLALTLLAVVAVAQAKYLQFNPEETTAYNYLEKYGLPLAEKIRQAEESNLRIVGGSIASPAQVPFQAGLLAQFSQGQGVCGASLISTTRLLTAAHCWFDGRNQASSFVVVLGSNTLFSGGTRIDTNEVVMHSGWNPNLIRNDVAIIRIPSVTLSSTIAVVALPSGSQLNENFAGETGVASGFGLTNDGGSISTAQALSYVQLEVISNNVCFFSFPFILQSSNVCTSGENGKSTCSGDSGGPLVVTRNNEPLLIGVTSFGSALGCEVGYPAVFVRVTSFMDFINENL